LTHITACETNRIHDGFILLPQFVFPEEVQKRNDDNIQRGPNPQVVAYTSFANPPRLLKKETLLSLMRGVSKRLNRRITLVIVNPAERVENRKVGQSCRLSASLFTKEPIYEIICFI
jgi:hypothetical protein